MASHAGWAQHTETGINVKLPSGAKGYANTACLMIQNASGQGRKREVSHPDQQPTNIHRQ